MTLQFGKGQGGLAVPNSRSYYLAYQLQQLGGWGHMNPSDPICALFPPQDVDHPALFYLEAGFTHLGNVGPTLALLRTLRPYV